MFSPSPLKKQKSELVWRNLVAKATKVNPNPTRNEEKEVNSKDKALVAAIGLGKTRSVISKKVKSKESGSSFRRTASDRISTLSSGSTFKGIPYERTSSRFVENSEDSSQREGILDAAADAADKSLTFIRDGIRMACKSTFSKLNKA